MKQAALFLTAIFAAGSTFAAEHRPNILLILTDDPGWSQVSQTMHPGVPEGPSAYLKSVDAEPVKAAGATKNKKAKKPAEKI